MIKSILNEKERIKMEREKLAMLEDIMELEDGVLKGDEVLDDLEEWDSMTALSFILLLSDEYDKTIGNTEIKQLRTIGDMLALMKEG